MRGLRRRRRSAHARRTGADLLAHQPPAARAGGSPARHTSCGTIFSASISDGRGCGADPRRAPTSPTSRPTETGSPAPSAATEARAAGLFPRGRRAALLTRDGPAWPTRPPGRPTAASSPTRAGSPAASATSTSSISLPARSGALRRSRHGRRSALLARRPLPALLVGPHRHLQRLRLRARQRAPVPGTNVLGGAFQPAVAPDGSAARLHRLHFATASTSSRRPSIRRRWPPAQPFANSRPDAVPATPDASPDGARRDARSGDPGPTSTTPGATCTRGPGT